MFSNDAAACAIPCLSASSKLHFGTCRDFDGFCEAHDAPFWLNKQLKTSNC